MTCAGHDPGGKVYRPLPAGVFGCAEFSECERYRYVLTREWGAPPGSSIAFVGLNPSTADKEHDDPTVKKCWTWAADWGYSSFVMLNVYAYRATNPKCLRTIADPTGVRNDEFLSKYASSAGRVIVAWGRGKTKADRERFRDVCELLSSLAIPLYCLRKNKDGSPHHPLYLPAAITAIPYRCP